MFGKQNEKKTQNAEECDDYLVRHSCSLEEAAEKVGTTSDQLLQWEKEFRYLGPPHTTSGEKRYRSIELGWARSLKENWTSTDQVLAAICFPNGPLKQAKYLYAKFARNTAMIIYIYRRAKALQKRQVTVDELQDIQTLTNLRKSLQESLQQIDKLSESAEVLLLETIEHEYLSSSQDDEWLKTKTPQATTTRSVYSTDLPLDFFGFGPAEIFFNHYKENMRRLKKSCKTATKQKVLGPASKTLLEKKLLFDLAGLADVHEVVKTISANRGTQFYDLARAVLILAGYRIKRDGVWHEPEDPRRIINFAVNMYNKI